MKERSLYEILDLKPTASDGKIKNVYRKLGLKYHPDRNPNAEDKFNEITSAYDTLSEPQK